LNLNWTLRVKGIAASLLLINLLLGYRCFYWQQSCNRWQQTNQAVEAYGGILQPAPETAGREAIMAFSTGLALEQLQEAATQSGIRVDNITAERHKAELYTISFTGPFSEIVTFLCELEGLMPPLVLTITSMEAGSDGIHVIMTAQAVGKSK